jgi:type IV pilus assembly protein PilO
VAGTLTKLPWYGQVGAFLGLSAAGVAVFFYFYVAPFQQEMTQRQRKLDALQLDIRKSQAIAQRLPQFRGEVADLETRLETLKNVLPEEKDMGDLLRRLQTMAVQSNLTIRGFKPVETPIAKQLHAEWPINLQLEGAYHNLALFFDRVSKFPRLIHVSGIAIKAKDRQEPDSTITADCVATTFVLLESRKAGAPAGRVRARDAAAPGARQ